MKRKGLRDLKTWARKVTRGQRDAAVFMSLWSDTMIDDPGREPIPLFQLAYAMILDKPIIVVAPHGSRIPENVRRAARAVEFFDRDNTASLHEATIRALRAAGIEVKH